MLDPWIIEEIRRREEREREDRQPAVIELPVHAPAGRDEKERGKPEEETPRGVVVIDM